MMSCADSVIYVNVRKRSRFCKGRVQPKSAPEALFVTETLANWRMQPQGKPNARSPTPKFVRKVRFHSR